MRKSDGFSLIELLIVVAIILIIAAIAIPDLLRARIAANEASAAAGTCTMTISAGWISEQLGFRAQEAGAAVQGCLRSAYGRLLRTIPSLLGW